MSTLRPQLIRYPNGFELLCVPSRAAPVVALDLWVRAGSAHESDQASGIAHFIEHMIFKGTARRPSGELAREVEALGGDINAFTSPDHTVYTLALASRFLHAGLDILSDAVFGSTFPEQEIERERRVVLEEIRRSRDLPEHCLSLLLFSAAYGRHPYGRSVIGTEETVSALCRNDCCTFAARHYRPDRMTLVVAGDAEPRALVPSVEALFGRPRPHGHGPKLALPRARSATAFRAVFESRPTEDAYFDLAFPGPSATDALTPAVDALVAVLGQGEASRLQCRVKLDRNLVRSVGAGAYAPAGPGLIYVGGSADPGKFEEAYAAICAELFRLCREPAGARELDRAKENLEADFVYQKETVQGQAQKAGYFHVVLGDVAAEDSYVSSLRRLTPADLRSAARRFLTPRRGLLALIHPGGSSPLSVAEATVIVERAAAGERRRVQRAPRKSRSRVSFCQLANGVRILVKRNPEVPLVALRAALLGGSRLEPVSRAGAFHVLADCYTRGTASRDAFEIAYDVDAIGGQIDGFSGRNSFGLKAEFLSKYLEDGLELFAEVLCQPSFPEGELEKVREDALGALRQRADHPASFAFRLFERALYPHHPYGWDVLGTARSVPRLSGRAIRRLFVAAARPEALAVAVAGDVDPNEVHAFFAEELGRLSAPEPQLFPPFPPAPPRAPVSVRATLPIEQAHVIVGFLGAAVDSPDRAALRVANCILAGQGGRLFRILRDELGLAYSVDSTCVEGLDRGLVAAYAATEPRNTDVAIARLLAEFGRVAGGDVTEEEIEEAKRKLVGSFELALQENAYQAAHLALDEVYGVGWRSLETYSDNVLSVTSDEVVAAARRYFVLDSPVCAVLEPTAQKNRRPRRHK